MQQNKKIYIHIYKYEVKKMNATIDVFVYHLALQYDKDRLTFTNKVEHSRNIYKQQYLEKYPSGSFKCVRGENNM